MILQQKCLIADQMCEENLDLRGVGLTEKRGEVAPEVLEWLVAYCSSAHNDLEIGELSQFNNSSKFS